MMVPTSLNKTLFVATLPLALHLVAALPAVQAQVSGQLLINEFRLRGPGGAQDEFIEIYNPGGGNSGYASAVRRIDQYPVLVWNSADGVVPDLRQRGRD